MIAEIGSIYRLIKVRGPDFFIVLSQARALVGFY